MYYELFLLCIYVFHFQVRDARNQTMHSTAMKMSIADFQMYTGSMIDLLEDGVVIRYTKEAYEAVRKIKEVIYIRIYLLFYSESRTGGTL